MDIEAKEMMEQAIHQDLEEFRQYDWHRYATWMIKVHGKQIYDCIFYRVYKEIANSRLIAHWIHGRRFGEQARSRSYRLEELGEGKQISWDYKIQICG